MDKLWSRKIRVHGHGKNVESSWPPRGHILWTVPDAAGKLPGCCADATLSAARTATAIAKSPANHRANFGAAIQRRQMRRFPPTAGTRLGSSPVIARMIHRMLRGCFGGRCPDTAPDAARTAAAIPKSFANHRANIGADINRRLVRCFPLTARMRLGSCPAIARMIHRMLRGHYGGHCAGRCADIARSLLGLRLYFLIRGWCLTKIPAFQFQKAAKDSVRLNTSN